jgi:hypothetical protein
MITETQMKTEIQNSEFWSEKIGVEFVSKGEDIVVNGKTYPTANVSQEEECFALVRFNEGKVYKKVANVKNINTPLKNLEVKTEVVKMAKPKITLVHPTSLF